MYRKTERERERRGRCDSHLQVSVEGVSEGGGSCQTQALVEVADSLGIDEPLVSFQLLQKLTLSHRTSQQRKRKGSVCVCVCVCVRVRVGRKSTIRGKECLVTVTWGVGWQVFYQIYTPTVREQWTPPHAAESEVFLTSESVSTPDWSLVWNEERDH